MKIKWILLGSSVCAATAFAQMDMSHMDMGSKAPQSKFASNMDVSMKQMDHDMATAPMTGDADHDFASMMVPHHQAPSIWRRLNYCMARTRPCVASLRKSSLTRNLKSI